MVSPRTAGYGRLHTIYRRSPAKGWPSGLPADERETLRTCMTASTRHDVNTALA